MCLCSVTAIRIAGKVAKKFATANIDNPMF